MFIVNNQQLLLDMKSKNKCQWKKKLAPKNSGKNTQDNHLSTLTFVIYRHPVTLFTRDADRHKLVSDLFYDFLSILLVLSS